MFHHSSAGLDIRTNFFHFLILGKFRFPPKKVLYHWWATAFILYFLLFVGWITIQYFIDRISFTINKSFVSLFSFLFCLQCILLFVLSILSPFKLNRYIYYYGFIYLRPFWTKYFVHVGIPRHLNQLSLSFILDLLQQEYNFTTKTCESGPVLESELVTSWSWLSSLNQETSSQTYFWEIYLHLSSYFVLCLCWPFIR